MDIYEKIDNLIKILEKNRYKTISQKNILKLLEEVADLCMNLDCLKNTSKDIIKKLWERSQNDRQSKRETLRELRQLKKILSDYDIKKEIKKLEIKKGKVIIFKEKQNFTAYNKLKDFFYSAKVYIDIIDPYLYSDIFKILKNINSKVKIRLITRNFYKDSKFEFKKFRKEYLIDAKENQNIHDRFFIVDDSGFFSGSSLHDVGNKLSAIAILNKEDTKNLKEVFNEMWNKSKKIK